MAPNGHSWSSLLQPWRYDFEYSTAWRELDFPLYGLVDELLVDGNLVRFEGAALQTVWVGMTRTSRTTIRVVASNISPDRIALGKISDPTRYFPGQRTFIQS